MPPVVNPFSESTKWKIVGLTIMVLVIAVLTLYIPDSRRHFLIAVMGVPLGVAISKRVADRRKG